MERPLAWQRPLQLPASMDEAWMALWLRQRLGSTLVGVQPLGLRQIPMASEVVVGLSKIRGLQRLPLASPMALRLPLHAGISILLVRCET